MRTPSRNVHSVDAQTFALVLVVRNPCLSETIPALNMRVKAFILHLSRFIELALTAVPFLMEPCPCCARKTWSFESQDAYYNWADWPTRTNTAEFGMARKTRNARIRYKNICVQYLDDKLPATVNYCSGFAKWVVLELNRNPAAGNLIKSTSNHALVLLSFGCQVFPITTLPIY